MPLFTRSELTSKIVNYLGAFGKGDHITYAELSTHVGTEITSLSSNLTYAIFILERDQNAVWTRVRPRIGVRRLNDAEIASRGRTWWNLGAQNKLARGTTQAEVVEIDKLTIDQQTAFAVAGIQREAALNSLSKASRKRLEQTARGNSNDLPSFNALEWMISLMPRKKS